MLAVLSINDIALAEGDSDTTSFAFEVALDVAVSQEVTVDVATIAGTALAADDFIAQSERLTFAPGELTKTFIVDVVGDLIVENDELFTVQLSAASGAEIADGEGIATIGNDDTAILSINDVSQQESIEDYVFTVSLDRPVDVRVDFDVRTDLDVVSLSIDPGMTEAEVTVTIPDNNIVEYDGEFDIEIENIRASDRAVSLGDSIGLGTIFDDDTATLSINDVMQSENEEDYIFTISLSNPVDLDIFFDVTTDLDTTTLVMDPLVTETTITISIPDNNIVEFDGFFEVLLSNLDADILPVSIDDSVGEGTIFDDDIADIEITDVTMLEGDSGTTAFVFTISLTNPVDSPIMVDFTTVDGTATTIDGDYQATSGTLEFDPQVTSQTVTVLVNGDSNIESNEAFTLMLDNLVFDAFLGDAIIIGDEAGEGMIQNDDVFVVPPRVLIGDASLAEGDDGTTEFVFTVTLANPGVTQVDVDFTVNGYSATIADNDFVAQSGTVSFIPGSNSPATQTITVLVNGDIGAENDEVFTVDLVVPDGVSSAKSVGVGTIVNDDDALPMISIDDISFAEGANGLTEFLFTVSLNPSVRA